MNERDETLLRDMLDAARQVESFVFGKTRDDLTRDNALIGFAVVRGLEIIGEAAAHITAETRDQLPEIPWKNIIGTRNRVIHDYNRVDYNIVWDIVSPQLPALIAQLQALLPPETDDSLPE